MNPRSLIPVLLVAAACGGASEPPSPAPSTPATTMAAAPSPTGMSVVAEVVTVDTTAPSLTLREGDVPPTRSPKPADLKAGDRTIRVEATAQASLSGVKPGDRLRVTCTPVQAMITTGASPGVAAARPAAVASPAGTGLAACDSIVAITPAQAAAR